MNFEERARGFWDGVFGARGLDAKLPAPLREALRFVYLVFRDFSRNRCQEKASSLAFQTILSLVPALVLSLFLLRSLGASETLGADVTRYILHQMNVDEIVLTIPIKSGKPQKLKLSDKLEEIVTEVDGVLRDSGTGLVSFLGIVIAAVFMALEIEYSMNAIWSSVGPPGGWLRRLGLYWSLVTVLPLFVALILYAARLLPGASALDEPLAAVLPFIAFYCMYQFVPAAHVERRAALLGAAVAAAAWHIAKRAFSCYLLTAVGYGDLYGILGLLPIFVMWIWFGWAIMLAGAEASYAWQNRARLAAHERRRRGAPFIEPGWAALELVVHAGAFLREGRAPATGLELELALGLPGYLWKSLISALLDRHILVRAGDGYVPGKPLDQLKVEDVLAAVEESVIARPDGNWHARRKIQELIDGLARARRREIGRLSVADLLDRAA
ncbi:MAG: YihY family inner membrane protein [Elusimicrobia bacterium]|nr:YihY family inner membrane protein [Elusimicrobiota bacterium]